MKIEIDIKSLQNKEYYEEVFNNISDNKGFTSVIAEKAMHNISRIVSGKQLYYFSIRHKFKDVDNKAIFQKKLNTESGEVEPTRLNNLNEDSFNKVKLKEIVKPLRNLNSHFLHHYGKVNLNNYPSQLRVFIKEAFMLALLDIYGANKDAEQLLGSTKALFSTPRSFPKTSQRINNCKNMTQLLDLILFVDVTELLPVIDNETRTQLFPIEPACYLSYWGMLFVLSMFLYRDEGSLLISKTKGLKKNITTEEKNKRKLFNFYTKKMSSQDYDNEYEDLLKFRDIINYLNKYPTAWNSVFEQRVTKRDKNTEELLRPLYKHYIFSDITSKFPSEVEVTENLIIHTAHQLIPEELFNMLKISKKHMLRTSFSGESEILSECKKLNQKTWAKLESLNFEAQNGRNQDRFMMLACRFLAENNYFGEQAQFRMYEFYSNEELEEALSKRKQELTKQEFDKLKYHNGQLTVYRTYKDHAELYKDWDMPFVEDNNAIQVKLKMGKDEVILNVQRKLMPYFLQDAINNKMYSKKSRFDLIKYYFAQKREVNKLLDSLKSNNIEGLNKTELKKVFPKRLLHHYYTKGDASTSSPCYKDKLLEDAKKAEQRYEDLLSSLTGKQKEEFINRNKGKQYKFRFIYKAWNLMFFKQGYLDNKDKAKGEHHKSHHITKEEFQDFSRYIYAFDDDQYYKTAIIRLLNSKGFYKGELERLISNSKTLNNLFQKTLKTFEDWEDNRVTNPDKYSIGNYRHLQDSATQPIMWYINLSHFRNYLKNTGALEDYWVTQNSQAHLIELLYDNKDMIKEDKQLFNTLRETKLEDSLLYDIAKTYYHSSTKKSCKYEVESADVSEILQGTVDIQVYDMGNLDHKIRVPFRKLPDFLQYSSLFSSEKEGFNLIKLRKYIKKSPKSVVEFDDIYGGFKELTRRANQFSEMAMLIEEYYISKHIKQHPEYNNYLIDSSKGYFELKELKGPSVIDANYTDELTFIGMRNDTLHYDIPNYSVEQMMKEIERKFIDLEVSKIGAKSWSNIPKDIQQVLIFFMTKVHNKWFERYRFQQEIPFNDVKDLYFKEIIKKIAPSF